MSADPLGRRNVARGLAKCADTERGNRHPEQQQHSSAGRWNCCRWQDLKNERACSGVRSWEGNRDVLSRRPSHVVFADWKYPEV